MSVADVAQGQKQQRDGGIEEVEVAVIGSGFSGLCMGIKLKEAGIEDFLILEKDAVFGGTWRVNHYPGAACDIPSHLYSLSFAQSADWSRKFPRQSELLEYTEGIVRDHGLQPHLRLDTALHSAHYDEARGRWHLCTSQGELSARMVVMGGGALSKPILPQVVGLENFRGTMFHSARWDHDYDLRGKRVAVIGTGASAIQFIPEVVKQAVHVDVYQRTPPWVLPRPDRPITSVERWLLKHVKPLQSLYRGLTYGQYEMRYVAFAKWTWLMRFIQAGALRHIRKQIPANEVLRAKVTPNYTFGCKRLLLSSDYYPALGRSHVDLITDGIAQVREGSVVTTSGEERAVDAIIFGTGFNVEDVLQAVDIRGRGGRQLHETGEHGAEAYKGISFVGFPNFFMITGPNTGLGHNSMIYMIESCVTYVMQAIKAIRAQNLHGLEVRADVSQQYNKVLQARFRGTVWSSGCKSWYLNDAGRNLVLWPGPTFEYRRITRHFDQASYRVTTAAATS
jgi:cation diffusion facilitator CzcD-associated flavoprotein CzcO